MKKLYFLIVVIFLFFLGSCENQIISEENTTREQDIIQNITVQSTSKENLEEETIEKQIIPSDLGLNKEELPEGWIIQFSSPKLSSDVDQKWLDYGWYDGYFYNYVKEGESDYFYSKIYQSISFYPEDKINRVILVDKDYYKDGYIVTYEDENTKIKDSYYYYEAMPDPQIGDSSLLYRVMNTETGDIDAYYLIFIKENAYVTLNMKGGIKDYSTFLDFAKKIEAKI